MTILVASGTTGLRSVSFWVWFGFCVHRIKTHKETAIGPVRAERRVPVGWGESRNSWCEDVFIPEIRPPPVVATPKSRVFPLTHPRVISSTPVLVGAGTCAYVHTSRQIVPAVPLPPRSFSNHCRPRVGRVSHKGSLILITSGPFGNLGPAGRPKHPSRKSRRIRWGVSRSRVAPSVCMEFGGWEIAGGVANFSARLDRWIWKAAEV